MAADAAADVVVDVAADVVVDCYQISLSHEALNLTNAP